MQPSQITVTVSWTGANYCAAWSDDTGGAVIVTAKTLAKLKDDFAETLRFHVEGCIADGDTPPRHLVDGDYTITYDLDAAALIRAAEPYTTMAAISRASGINRKQLSHYATGIKTPRPIQKARIKAALALIATQLLQLG